MANIAVRAAHPGYLDDEIVALTLQVEEINYREETKKAKYPVNDIPDLEIAYASYLNEIEAHLSFLRDVKLAHSIANAVDTDAQAIAEVSQENRQAQDDHYMAVQMSAEDPDLEAPPPYTQEARSDFIEDELCAAWQLCWLVTMISMSLLNLRLVHRFRISVRLLLLTNLPRRPSSASAAQTNFAGLTQLIWSVDIASAKPVCKWRQSSIATWRSCRFGAVVSQCRSQSLSAH